MVKRMSSIGFKEKYLNSLMIENKRKYSSKDIKDARDAGKIYGVLLYIAIPYLCVGVPIAWITVSTGNFFYIVLALPISIFFSIPAMALMVGLGSLYKNLNEADNLVKQSRSYEEGVEDLARKLSLIDDNIDYSDEND